jgi:hypothetical protein
MNAHDQDLAHRIKLKFGTVPDNPNEQQLEGIKRDIRALISKGVTPSESDWYSIVKRYCPNAGSYSYHGVDNSDLITLLQLATK